MEPMEEMEERRERDVEDGRRVQVESKEDHGL